MVIAGCAWQSSTSRAHSSRPCVVGSRGESTVEQGPVDQGFGTRAVLAVGRAMASDRNGRLKARALAQEVVTSRRSVSGS